MRWLKRGLLALIALYALLVAGLYFGQRALIFPIPGTQRTAPQAAQFPQAEEHVLTTADGEKLILWHVPPQGDRPVVVFFHGNGDLLAWRVPRFRAIVAGGVGLAAVSFRGYAGSSGKPSEQGLLNDGAAAYAFAAGKYPPDRLVIWGFSLGSGVAVAVAAENPVGRIILEAPYTSATDVASSKVPFVPVSLLLKDTFRSDQRIAKVTAPLLIMHGALDNAIPIRFGEKLYSLAPGPKHFVRFPRGGHELLDDVGAMDTALAFINTPLEQLRADGKP